MGTHEASWLYGQSQLREFLGEPFYFLGAFCFLRSFAFSCRDVSPLRLTLTDCFLAGVFCITMSYEF